MLLLLGCGRGSESADPGPAPPAPPPVAEDTQPVAAPDVAAEEEPTIPLRLLLRDGRGDDAPHDLRTLEATVLRGDEKLAEGLKVTDLQTARVGMAVLVLLSDDTSRRQQAAGARAFLGTLGPRDRVAVGVITSKGFRVVYDFSADAHGAESAVDHLAQTGPGTEDRDVRLHAGLHQALDAFRGRYALPRLRAVVIMSDGVDPTIRRSSQRAHARAQVHRRAEYHEVRVFALGPTDSTLKPLAEATGGEFTTLAAPTKATAIAAAWKQLGQRLRRYLVVDVTLAGLSSQSHLLRVSVRDSSSGRSFGASRTIEVPEPSRDFKSFDMTVAAPPERVLPVGIRPGRDLIGEAQAAEKAGLILRAGALWHLARQVHPERREAAEKARELDARHRAAPASGLGSLIVSDERVATDVAVAWEPALLQTLWHEELKHEESITTLYRERLPPPADPSDPVAPAGDPPIQQVVLHRCEATTARACAVELLRADRATHLFVAPDGQVTQLLDLSRIPLGTDAREAVAISVHLGLPPDEASTSLDPADPGTWRIYHRRSEETDVNTARRAGWDLSEPQYDALVPLLHTLTKLYPDVLPVVPVDLERRPTFHALLRPHRFAGILCHSNLVRTESHCPGPGLQLRRLNDAVQRWNYGGQSTDLERWIAELSVPGHRLGAVARYLTVGELAVPLLLEVASELAPAEAQYAVRALARISAEGTAAALAPLLKRALPEDGAPASDEVVALVAEVLDALIRIGTREQLPAATALFEHLRDTAEPPAELTRLAAAAVLALSERPEDIAPITPWLSSDDPSRRALATAAVVRFGGEQGKEELRARLEDPSPWVRWLAASGMGPEGSPVLVQLREPLGVRWVVEGLLRIHPESAGQEAAGGPPIPQLLGWFDEADPADRYALSDLFIRWRWALAVRAFALKLAGTRGHDRQIILRTLKGITGRDFGSSPDGWLRWRPAAP